MLLVTKRWATACAHHTCSTAAAAAAANGAPAPATRPTVAVVSLTLNQAIHSAASERARCTYDSLTCDGHA